MTFWIKNFFRKIFGLELIKKFGKGTSKDKQKDHAYLEKFCANPILKPIGEHLWESWQTFNPGAVLLNDRIHFLYRAIGQDGFSRLGYAVSGDGLIIDERLPYPVFEHRVSSSSFNYYSFASGGSWGGCEDPRLVRVDNEDVLYMTYTACDGGLGVALTSIKIDDFLNRVWKWKRPKLISCPGEVHKNWVIFPEKINGKYAILHTINPEIKIHYIDNLDFKNGECLDSCHGGSGNGKNKDKCWYDWVRGVGAPPIKTKYGWLVFYHAIEESDSGKYKVGAMVLDLKNPTKILHHSSVPVLVPDKSYENEGFKAGIVYVSGAVVKNEELFVYYGGADNFVCAAHINLEEFLQKVISKKNPKLKNIFVKQKPKN